VCKASVYYYENEHGSRVFFDNIGPPWPKHPCTDTGLQVVHQGCFPTARASSDISELLRWWEVKNAGPNFETRESADSWALATILDRFKRGTRVFLVLRPLQSPRSKEVYASCTSLPKCCCKGFCVSVRKGQINFFDTNAMASKTVTIARYRGARAFLDAMIEGTIRRA